MTLRITFLAGILVVLVACNPGRNDRLIKEVDQRAHDDSLKHESDKKHSDEIKSAISDSISGIQKEVSFLEKELINVKAELEVQKDKLPRIKAFKFLRSTKERESQIRQQVKIISSLEDKSIQMQDRILNLQIRLDNFQREIQNGKAE